MVDSQNPSDNLISVYARNRLFQLLFLLINLCLFDLTTTFP